MINKLKKINFLYLFVIFLLQFIGFTALYSAGGGNLDPWALKHLTRFGILFIMLFVIILIDLKMFYKYAYLIFLLSLFFLGSVEIAGTFGFGAKRWIRIFGVSLQPSELVKVTLILFLARYYHDLNYNRLKKIFPHFIPIFFIIIPFILILTQPDLGTAVTVLILGILILFQVGLKIWKFVMGFAIALILSPFAWNLMKPYQQKRFISFLDPESDPLGQGYQLIQSKIALGSGGLSGKGFLEGTQSYLEYLPEKQTDFIFTLIGEEFGFMGAMFVLVLFLMIIIIGFYISLKSNHIFGKILAVGISINIFLYTILNMFMVVGLLPVVGIPLPLISYGGTAMLSTMISFGLILNVYINQNLKKLE